ncbi:DUF4233 domain-containing protein [Paenarthrobacter sp. DKR-5]|uniref:DUF4233 domain-containing protein n=1 Tax=Paenarthrobacter sp. DKR-5 TaxID=2835535 RepID=UPI001BDC0295|nr:DUF4233 domain-containing protein [Paenarthrobacter sp. DKR-5]MBT1003835.1 DUF4233 domain-containing protein [Paenarthrobacter sp. DKR-5]
MARLTKAQRDWRPGTPKRRRSTRVMFTSTVLGLEAFVAFFATLVVFGQHTGNLPGAVTLVAGLLLSVILVASCAFMAKPWGVLLGWILQLVLICLGFVEPMMFLVGVLFAAAWWYAVRTGRRIDREVAAREKAQAEWEQAHPGNG